jgi:hypothetical protein
MRRPPPHQQIVRTTRGQSFSLCRRSRIEPDRFVPAGARLRRFEPAVAELT